MPGFPDKFMPFMDKPPGANVSAGTIGIYGRAIRKLRSITNSNVIRSLSGGTTALS